MKARQQLTRFIGRLFAVSLIASLACWGCTVGQKPLGSEAGPAAESTHPVKTIDRLEVVMGEDGHELFLKGGPDLVCSHFKKTEPLSIAFYFPQTTIQAEPPVLNADHPVIADISANQLSAGGHTAKVLVSLKADVDYRIDAGAENFRILLQPPKAAHGPNGAPDPTISESSIPGPGPAHSSNPVPPAAAETGSRPATSMESIDALVKDDSTEIVIYADGAIKDYNTFIIKEPPRIVFDLHRIDSRFEGLQNIGVASQQVQSIRHFGHPDKVRLVVDTQADFLDRYSAQSLSNGLRIRIGIGDAIPVAPEALLAASTEPRRVPAPVIVAASEPAPTPAPQPTAVPTSGVAGGKAADAPAPAWLDQIEFSSAESGASKVLIGTTAPVSYDVEKVNDRELRMKLYRTRVPEYRKRPLITTRFNSAVDRVTPVQAEAMADTAVIRIELREAVEYDVAKDGKRITVSFAPSAIPPKPLEQTRTPNDPQAEAPAPMAAVSDDGQTVETDAGIESETVMAAEDAPQAQGEIYQERQDTLLTDEFDLRRQQRRDEVTGAQQPLDLYQTRKFKRYTGEKIALNFYETDIKNVFRILGEISQQNFAIDKNVTGRVTLNFEKPVPWDQVLDLVLKMNQLGRTMEGDIIRIATLQTLADEEKVQREKLAEKQAREDQEDLVTLFLRLSYIDALETARDHLVGNPDEPPGKWISKFNPDRGKVSVDPKQNMIVVTDIPRSVKRAKEIVEKLDKVTPQVLIEARVVETTTEFSREMGFDWGNVSIGSFGLGDWGEITGINLTSSNPTNSTPTGTLSFGFSKLGGTSFDIVDATLEVFERQGETKTISSPKVLTLDGKQAIISQGFEIPYEERDSAGGSSIAFKEALLELTVTPQVTPDDRIALKLDLTRDDVTDITLPNPPLTTNVVKTELLVEDGETIVIGGIITADLADSEEGIPGLMHIPAFGYLFKTAGKRDRQTELLIFLTPKIIKLEQKVISG